MHSNLLISDQKCWRKKRSCISEKSRSKQGTRPAIAEKIDCYVRKYHAPGTPEIFAKL